AMSRATLGFSATTRTLKGSRPPRCPRDLERNVTPPREAAPHGVDGRLALVDEDERAAVLERGRAGRAAAGEEVEHHPALRRRGLHDAPEDPERLLRRVPELLLAGRADDRVPPRIRRQLAGGRLL